MNPLPEKNSSSTDRWILARDIGVLQAKLLVDGLRDLLLVPASLITGLVSLLSNKGDKANHYFYQLLDLGSKANTG